MYVGITSRFLYDLEHNIDSMRQKEMATLDHHPMKHVSGLEEPIQRLLWGDGYDIRNQVPDWWKAKTQQLHVHYSVDGKTYSHYVNLPSGVDYVAGPKTGYGAPSARVSESDPFWKPLFEYQRTHKEIDERWQTVEHQILAFFNKCKSLNDALKQWPQVEMYVPKHYLERVREKRVTEKKEAVDATQGLDTDLLVSSAVIARMSTNKE